MGIYNVRLVFNQAALISVDQNIARKTESVALALRDITKASMGTSGFPRIITGKLKASIQSKKINKYLYTVFSDIFYAPFVEFGTSKSSPKPFFRPNIARLVRRIRGLVSRF